MVARLNRAQQQEHGYVEAKIDRIAEQADLTRGAVYSNFTGKRALYLAVLADDAERAGSDATPPAQSPGTVEDALGAFARVWLERLPLAGDSPASGHGGEAAPVGGHPGDRLTLWSTSTSRDHIVDVNQGGVACRDVLSGTRWRWPCWPDCCANPCTRTRWRGNSSSTARTATSSTRAA